MFLVARTAGEDQASYMQRATAHAEQAYWKSGGQSIIVAFLKRWLRFVMEIYTKDVEKSNVRQPLRETVAWRGQLHWDFLQAAAQASGKY